MGCDIHSRCEVRDEGTGKWTAVGEIFPLDDVMADIRGKKFGDGPFDWRSYGMFGFLANVRNYSHVPSMSDCRGIPEDVSPETKAEIDSWEGDGHSHGWLSVKELLNWDYSQTFEDRRITKQIAPNYWDGAALANPGEGETTTFRKFLGEDYFRDLEIMRRLGSPENVRIVFWFDN